MRTLGVVDSADDGDEREGNRNRQILQSRADSLQESERGKWEHDVEFASGRLVGATDEAGRREQIIEDGPEWRLDKT